MSLFNNLSLPISFTSFFKAQGAKRTLRTKDDLTTFFFRSNSSIGVYSEVILNQTHDKFFDSKVQSNQSQTDLIKGSNIQANRVFDSKSQTSSNHLKSRIGLKRIGSYSIIGHLTISEKYCLEKFIHLCMKNGKKNKSFKIISKTLQRLSLLEGPNVFTLFTKAIENVKPRIEVKKVRISGTTQLVPSILPQNRQTCLAIRWIIEAAILRRNMKKSMTLDQSFFAELLDASQNIGVVRKRRDDLHKLAESNRGFAHYRWW